MTGHAKLERRYRRLLALYPRVFRSEHQEEILSVLMDGAGPDQRWPAMSESADLVTNGLRARGRYGFSWERTHYPRVWLGVRVAVGVWLLVLTGLMCAWGIWWGLALLAPAALHFYLAYRIARCLESER
jgi:hypothetical protein